MLSSTNSIFTRLSGSGGCGAGRRFITMATKRGYHHSLYLATSTVPSNKSFKLQKTHPNLSPRIQVRFNTITASTDGTQIPDDVKNLTIEKYHEVADETFEILLDDLDSFFEKNKIMEADVDEEAGVMQINCSEGTYVINKQPPTKQIWLASPISGPKRFDFHNNQWICLRDNVKLADLLKNEMELMYTNFQWSKQF